MYIYIYSACIYRLNEVTIAAKRHRDHSDSTSLRACLQCQRFHLGRSSSWELHPDAQAERNAAGMAWADLAPPPPRWHISSNKVTPLNFLILSNSATPWRVYEPMGAIFIQATTYTPIFCMWVCVGVGVCLPWCTGGGEGTVCRSQLSPYTVCIPDVELRSLGLAANTFPL